MNLEVFSTTESLITLETMVRLLIGVCSYMNQHLVPEDKKEIVS